MKNTITLFLVLTVAGFLSVACNEIFQTVSPSPVEVTITIPTGEELDPTPPETSGTITLEPAAVEVEVGKNVNVKVTIKNAAGQEVPSSNISVNISDRTILELVEIDERIIQFGGVAAGSTSVIISAGGLQASLVATVTN